MPVKSYLAYPTKGKGPVLAKVLGSIPGCETISATNRDLLILVTETPSVSAEKALADRLKEIDTLQCLALVSAYEVPNSKEVKQ